MLRLTAIAFAAAATLGAASLASTAPAAAHGWKGHHHWHKHHFHVRPVHYGCWRKVWINLPYGGGFWKRINVCR